MVVVSTPPPSGAPPPGLIVLHGDTGSVDGCQALSAGIP